MKKIKSSVVQTKIHKLINLKKVNTLYLDEDLYDFETDGKNIKLCNVNDVIISKGLLKKNNDIDIYETTAKNIYFEGRNNLGGITLNYDDIVKSDISISIYNDLLNYNNIEIVNLKLEDKIIQVPIEKKYNSIDISKDSLQYIVRIELETNKSFVLYIVYRDGVIKEYKQYYRIDKTDIENDTLDLRNFLDYLEVYSPSKMIDTLIINKDCITKIDSLRNFDFYGVSMNKQFNYKKLRIVDDNDMKLFLYDKTYEIKKCLFLDFEKKLIYIETMDDDEIIIYIDQYDNLKSISKKSLLSNDDVSEVQFCFKERTAKSLSEQSYILVKYNNGFGKVILFDKEINIDKDLISFITRKKYKDLEFTPDWFWFTLFTCRTFSNKLLENIVEDYEKFNEYKRYIKTLGLTDNAINYLFDKEYLKETDKIDFTDKEISCFNELGEEHEKIKKKVLKRND